MILMGTGTSHGIPVIGCDCAVCRSDDVRDKRLRCSLYVSEPASVVIDTGPEFRIQALRCGIKRLDAVLLTHSHADHLHGIDDLRVFSHTKSVDPSFNGECETFGEGLPIYANSQTVNDIENRFGGFDESAKERVTLHIAYTKDAKEAGLWKQEVMDAFPGFRLRMAPLSLSVACHIGPGALALACTRNLIAE